MYRFLLLASLMLPLLGFSQWKNHTPSSAQLRDIQFVDQYHGFSVGNGGAIGNCQLTYNFYKTIDGGENWIKMRTGTTNQPQALHFLDNKLGWVVCTSSEILKTTDGGMSWAQQNQGVGSGYNDVWFVNSQRGFVIGNNGLLRRSTNGGSSWQTISSGTNSALRRIHFTSTNIGFIAVSGGEILRTDDSGNSWDDIDFGASSINGFSSFDELNAAASGFLDGVPHAFITTDGGLSWTPHPLEGDQFTVSIDMVTPDLIYVASSGGIIWKTENGGQTWTQTITVNGIYDAWRSIDFTNPLTGYLSGDNGKIYKTINGGVSWFSQQTGFSDQVNTVEAIHRDTTYFGDNDGRIFKSVNAGVNIKQVLPNQETPVAKIIALSEQEVIAAFSKKVMKSTDGGLTWEEKYADPDVFLNDMHFPTEEVGYISALDSMFLKTTDRGETWQVMDPDFDAFYKTLWFTSEDTGYMASDEYILKTTDGGLSWSEYWLDQFPLTVTGFSRDIVFPSDSIGYLANSQEIFWTRDAGTTWEERSATGGFTLNEMFWESDTVGWATRGTSQAILPDSALFISSASTACLSNNWSMHGIDITDGGEYGYSVGGLGGLLHQLEQREILPPILTSSTFCTGSEMFVGFIGKGLHFSGSLYEVQLSDSNGDFTNPTTLGTMDMDDSSVYQSSVVYCPLSGGLPSGNGYRIRVFNSVTGVISPDNGYDITIASSIQPEVSIVGTDTGVVCPGDLVELNASFVGEGNDPDFIWSVNGEEVLNGSSYFFSSELGNGDVVSLSMESSLSCAVPSLVDAEAFAIAISPLIDTQLPDTLNGCASTDLLIEPSDEYNYAWNENDLFEELDLTTPIANGDSSEMLYFTATDINSCSIEDSLFVELAPLPEILSNDTTVCIGSFVQLEATEDGVYNWTPSLGLSDDAVSNPIAEAINPTTYILETTSADGCFAIDSVQISLDEPIFITSPDTLVCPGEPVSIEVNSVLGSFTWTPSEVLDDSLSANPVASVSEETVIVMNALSELGCSYEDSLRISVAVFPQILTNDTSFCEPTSLLLNVDSLAGNTYRWSPEELFVNPNVANAFATIDSTQTLTLSTQSDFGCDSESSITVTINDVIEITTADTLIYCNPSNALLVAEPGGTYEWSSGGQVIESFLPIVSVSFDEPTWYYLEATSAEGCQNVDSVFIDILANQTTTIIAEDPSFCQGECTSLSFNSDQAITNWEWFPASSLDNSFSANPTACPVETTTYTLQYTGFNGCNRQTSIQVVVNLNPVMPSILLDGSLVNTLAQSEQYLWYVNSDLIEDGANQSIIPEVNGFYQVEVIDEFGCSSISDSLEVIVISVEENQEQLWRMSHRPGTEELILEHFGSRSMDGLVRVLDSTGKTIAEAKNLEELRTGEGLYRISTSGWSAGWYVVQVYGKDHAYSGKVVLSR